jgi:hypothetical protein
MAIVAGDAPDIRDEWGKYRSDDVSGRGTVICDPALLSLLLAL